MAQRLEKGTSFLRAIHEHSGILSSISAEEGGRVSREKFNALVTTFYDGSEKTNARIYTQLTEMVPEPILLDEPPYLSVQHQVAELFNWLTNRLGIRSHHTIESLLNEIDDSRSKMDSAIDNKSPHYKMILAEGINRIEYRSEDLVKIGSNNLNSVSRALQEFKESDLSSEKRAFLANEILSDYIYPMNELIEPGGRVDSTLQNARVLLNLIQSTNAFSREIRDAAARLLRIQRAVRAKLIEVQRVALRSLIPELELYVYQASPLEKNCATALRLFNTYSAKFLPPVRELNLFKEVRRFNLIPDASIQQYSFRESRVQKQHRIDLSAVTDFAPPLEVEDITQKIVESNPDDVLQAVLTAFPKESLDECNRITTDFIIQRRVHSSLRFFEIKTYAHNGSNLEVTRVGIR